MIQRENPVATPDGPMESALADYFTRLDGGESVDVPQLIAAYPGCEAGLRRFLSQERKVQQALVETPTAAAPPEHLAGRTLGDYRILRELGRGGMGVVYEAEQLSLGRRVALKVLPFAAMLSNQQLVRFKNEARAAATLDHPNIVAIYSVGSQGDVHYYAMQLIEGPSLARVIETLRRAKSPTAPPAEKSLGDNALPTDAEQLTIDSQSAQPPSTSDTAPIAHLATLHALCSTLPVSNSREFYRTVARLGIQAAEALDYSHQNGILHRDIKPGNLLLDADGKLYVTDFGLARIEADAGITMTGDIIGTLRYMAPEQALATRVVVDHRIDIYSLGATLYELFTLQPAFAETDRSELLKQITLEEPRSLRKLDRCIPAELETIVLKAMAKNPDERYQTAQALKDDLCAFLEDRPIKAKPPTLLNRIARWSRRHKRFMASVAILVLLAAIGSSVSAVMLAEERDKTAAALEVSESQKQQLEIKSQLLERERRRAETNLQKARDAIDRMFTRVAKDLTDQPHMDQIRRQLLEDALKFYQGFLSQNQDDLAIRHETALTYMRVGEIYNSLGEYAEALKALEQSRSMLEELASQNPADPQYRLEQARTHYLIGFPMIGLHRLNEYLANKRKELTVCEELHREFPANAKYLRWSPVHTGVSHSHCVMRGKRRNPSMNLSNPVLSTRNHCATSPTYPRTRHGLPVITSGWVNHFRRQVAWSRQSKHIARHMTSGRNSWQSCPRMLTESTNSPPLSRIWRCSCKPPDVLNKRWHYSSKRLHLTKNASMTFPTGSTIFAGRQLITRL